ncbi:hypothetical protein AQI88_08800 [Streptomyces cellostaticus]|uniref:Cytochrome n=1 Tax=Streptomyces cellostaticus TaxID=67285 RepID=A0A101NQB7_9ACTN|nr:hypothetical protein [Streptomyces cellostaticus]KUM97097.1 hypothetical protein AQI88_08800 [Streptomyces cellostaticus]GHI03836.1 hypothetical protein Scel_21570 [Streptomyces cellostaticus]
MDLLAAHDAIPEDDVPQRVVLPRQTPAGDKAAHLVGCLTGSQQNITQCVAPVTPRLCLHDHTLAAGTPRQTVIAARSVVPACCASAMFDEEVVEAPLEFRPGRPSAHNPVLGYGAHDCLGGYAALVIVPEPARRVLLRPGIRPLPGGERALDHAGTPFPQHDIVSSGRPAGNAT